jgi:hypothetical protein
MLSQAELRKLGLSQLLHLKNLSNQLELVLQMLRTQQMQMQSVFSFALTFFF